MLRRLPTLGHRRSIPGEHLWAFRSKGMIQWSCKLREHGQHGIEAQILRNGHFYMSWRFPTRANAIAWAEAERLDRIAGY